MYQHETRRKYKMRVRTQQCPCFKITAGCTAAKFPVLFFAAMEQGKNCHVLLAKRKSWHEQSLSTSLQIRNGSSVRTVWFQVNFSYLNISKRATGGRCFYCTFSCHDTTACRDGRQDFSCRRVCQKQKWIATVSKLPTPAAAAAALLVTQQ